MGYEHEDKVIGIGVDIIEVDRISRDLDKPFFTRMFCTQDESDFFDSLPDAERAQCYAECLSTKESVYKALNGASHGLSWQEAILRRNEEDQPFVELTGKAKQLAAKLGITSLSLIFTEVKNVPIVICIATGPTSS